MKEFAAYIGLVKIPQKREEMLLSQHLLSFTIPNMYKSIR